MGRGIWLTGAGVAAGTVVAAERSARMGLIGRSEVERVRGIYSRAGRPVVAPNLGPEKYLSLMGLDKKVEGGKMRFILLKHIGEAVVHSAVPATLLT